MLLVVNLIGVLGSNFLKVFSHKIRSAVLEAVATFAIQQTYSFIAKLQCVTNSQTKTLESKRQRRKFEYYPPQISRVK